MVKLFYILKNDYLWIFKILKKFNFVLGIDRDVGWSIVRMKILDCEWRDKLWVGIIKWFFFFKKILY